jgi:hypothetical protein
MRPKSGHMESPDASERHERIDHASAEIWHWLEYLLTYTPGPFQSLSHSHQHLVSQGYTCSFNTALESYHAHMACNRAHIMLLAAAHCWKLREYELVL